MTYMDQYGNQAGSSAPVRTPDMPGVFPIGQQPTSPCEHDFVLIRSHCLGGGSPLADADATYIDVFYCRRCLEYREVTR